MDDDFVFLDSQGEQIDEHRSSINPVVCTKPRDSSVVLPATARSNSSESPEGEPPITVVQPNQVGDKSAPESSGQQGWVGRLFSYLPGALGGSQADQSSADTDTPADDMATNSEEQKKQHWLGKKVAATEIVQRVTKGLFKTDEAVDEAGKVLCRHP